jgi:hypothetical protein
MFIPGKILAPVEPAMPVMEQSLVEEKKIKGRVHFCQEEEKEGIRGG